MKLKELEESVKKANEAGIQLGYYSNDDVLALIETVNELRIALIDCYSSSTEFVNAIVDRKLEELKQQWGLGGEGE